MSRPLKGLILSGGKGTRLRPITHTSAKQLIPIGNRPILFRAIDALVAARITDIGIITGATAAEVEEQVGDGSAFGAHCTFIHQEAPLGLAHAVLTARDFLADSSFVMYLGDNLVRNGIVPIVDEFRASEPDAMILLAKVPEPQHFGVAELEGGRVVRLVEKPVTYLEPLELASGVTLRHGQVNFASPSSGTIGGLYNGSIVNANCVAGFLISPNGAGSSIQALINGAPIGPALNTVAGHVYSFATRILCSEASRLRQTYLSSQHPAGSGRGGETVAATARVVLAVHDVDPNNPATLGAVATVLFDGMLAAPPSFATYALINSSSLHLALSFTQLQRVPDVEVRSQIPGGSFRTRLAGSLVDGGECSVSAAGEVRFFPQYPPQPNEQIVVSYRTSARAIARVQDQSSIAAQQKGSDRGQRMLLRRLTQPSARTSQDCENAALAMLDDTVSPAWSGTYATISDFLALDPLPGDAVDVNAPSRDAQFSATVRQVQMDLLSLADERWRYTIVFANDAAATLAFASEALTLATPLSQIWTTTNPSSSQVLDPLAAAQITAVTPSTVTMDAGTAPPAGGGIEVRRSDAGWGAGSAGNLAGTIHHNHLYPAAAVARAGLLSAAIRRFGAGEIFALFGAAVCGLSVMNDISEFEQKVLTDLAELKAHMRWIVGNGNQGKMQELEERVDRHEAYLQRFTGIAAAVASLLTVFNVAISYLRLRH